MYVPAGQVLSPKGLVKNLTVVWDGGEWKKGTNEGPWAGWSLVRLEWDGADAVGFRWNGGAESVGNPHSRGLPTWSVMPDLFGELVADFTERNQPGARHTDRGDDDIRVRLAALKDELNGVSRLIERRLAADGRRTDAV